MLLVIPMYYIYMVYLELLIILYMKELIWLITKYNIFYIHCSHYIVLILMYYYFTVLSHDKYIHMRY